HARWREPENGDSRSAEGAWRTPRQVHGCRYTQYDCLPGDTEMNIRRVLLSACLAALPCAMIGQGLTQDVLLKQPTDAWPTYNGDYSGRRFSPLTQINSSNVHTLSLAWVTRYTAGGGGGGRSGAGGGAPAGVNIQIKSTPLMVNGILYFTSP